MAFGKLHKFIFLVLMFLILTAGVYAEKESGFPLEDFWSLDAGLGMSGILVDGSSFQLVVDPKLWLSPTLMVGSRVGINYSVEDDTTNNLGNILTFEGQVYMRWNFLHLGREQNPVNVFFQAGLGLLSAYRGTDNPFNEVTETRGSLLVDGALGVTIPLSERWHIEPSVRGGYPHLFGFLLTAGYKFPLPQVTRIQRQPPMIQLVEVMRELPPVEIIKELPPEEIVKMVMIFAVEYVLFGPDIGLYNVGVDRDAQQLNELVLNYTAQTLKDNPHYRVRIEGHANPYTINPSEIDELMTLSAMRSEVVSEQLRSRGVSNDQMVIISYGGTRTATSEWDVRNRNRRVELIITQVDADR
jgi:hypothetical protein